MTFSDEFLDRIGLVDRKHEKHGYYVLEELEAFFLVCDEKTMVAPAPQPVTPGSTVHIAETSTCVQREFRALVRPVIHEEGKKIILSIEAPEKSGFALAETVVVRLNSGQSVYLPSRDVVAGGQGRAYLVLMPRIESQE